VEDAEDVMQETFTRAYRQLHTLRQPDRFPAWISRVALSCAHDLTRRRAREIVMDTHTAFGHRPTDGSAQVALERGDDVTTLLASSLAALPESIRLPVTMRFMEGMSHRAIAEALVITPRAAETRIARGLRRMREHLSRSGREEDCRDLLRTYGVALGATGESLRLAADAVRRLPPHAPADGKRPTALPLALAGGVAAFSIAAGLYGTGQAMWGAVPTASVPDDGYELISVDVPVAPLPEGFLPLADGSVVLYQPRFGDTREGARPAGWSAGVSATTEDAAPGGGAGAAKVTTNIPAAWVSFPRTRGTVTVDVSLKPGLGPDTNLGLYLGNDLGGWSATEGPGVKFCAFAKTSDDEWLYWRPTAGAAERVHVADADDQWRRVRLTFDTARNVYDVQFDGRTVGRDVPAGCDLSAGISAVGFNSGRWRYGEDTPSYFDELRVHAVLAEASAPAAIARRHDPPVIEPTAGSYDAGHAQDPCVVYRDGTYHMWYTARPAWYAGSRRAPTTVSIAYATSTDGRRWTKRGPVLHPTDAWEGLRVSSPVVLADGGQFHMWYRGESGDGGVTAIGHATSPDGVHWVRDALNPVTVDGVVAAEFALGPGTVVKSASGYVMWALRAGRIARLASVDGVSWHDGDALTVDGAAWDVGRATDLCALARDDGHEMWYVADGHIRRATSNDGVRWTPSTLTVAPGPPGDWSYPAIRSVWALADGHGVRVWYAAGAGRIAIGETRMHGSEPAM
jgi:RNA polymerase sigma factor (sigma-70 family)